MDNSLSKWTVDDAIGGAWVAQHYGIDLVQPLRTLSRIGRSRLSHRDGNRWQKTYVERYRPTPTLGGHLGFMLKHEVLSLEFLARLFKVIEPEELSNWVGNEPTGQYARRAGFLYEWLRGRQLAFDGVENAPYVNALSKDYFATRNVRTN